MAIVIIASMTLNLKMIWKRWFGRLSPVSSICHFLSLLLLHSGLQDLLFQIIEIIIYMYIYIYIIHAHLFLSSSSRQMKEENDLKWLLLSTAHTHSKRILMCSAFCRCWDLEVKRSAKTLKKPALSRVLIKCYGRSYAVAGLFVFFLVGAGGERRRKSVICSPYLLCCAWAFLESAFACKPHYTHDAAI